MVDIVGKPDNYHISACTNTSIEKNNIYSQEQIDKAEISEQIPSTLCPSGVWLSSVWSDQWRSQKPVKYKININVYWRGMFSGTSHTFLKINNSHSLKKEPMTPKYHRKKSLCTLSFLYFNTKKLWVSENTSI